MNQQNKNHQILFVYQCQTVQHLYGLGSQHNSSEPHRVGEPQNRLPTYEVGKKTASEGRETGRRLGETLVEGRTKIRG